MAASGVEAARRVCSARRRGVAGAGGGRGRSACVAVACAGRVERSASMRDWAEARCVGVGSASMSGRG
jgi:hypothetical protein